MAFAEDLSVFLSDDDFAVAASYTHSAVTTTVNGIFDAEYREVLDVESASPAFLCDTDDVSAAVHGDTLVVDGTTYTVVSVQDSPDGFPDCTRLKLRRSS